MHRIRRLINGPAASSANFTSFRPRAARASAASAVIGGTQLCPSASNRQSTSASVVVPVGALLGSTQRRLCSSSSNDDEAIRIEDVAVLSEEDVYSHTAADRTASPGDDGGDGATAGHSLPSAFADVEEIDTFSRARVMNFLKRATSAEDRVATDKSGIAVEVKEIRVGDDRTHYHARLRVPVPGEFGVRFGEGYACNSKDAELLAVMHAERVIDALGFQIYTLPSMQRKHAFAARKAGRWAPGPDDARKEPSTPSPRPLRRVLFADESEGGQWALVDTRPHFFVHESHTLLTPALIDPSAANRIRAFFHVHGASFEQHLKVRDAPKMTAGNEGPLLLAELRLPVPDKFGCVRATAKAVDRRIVTELVCMHAELILDTLGIPLYSTEEVQNSHAAAARSYGRVAPMAGDPMARPGAVLLPTPLKQLPHDVANGHRPRDAPLTADEEIVANHRAIITESTARTEVAAIDPGARAALLFFVRARGLTRTNPFLVEKLGGVYRASVHLPLPALYGTRGGVGVGATVEEAEGLAAMHAVDVLHHVGIPPFEGDADRQQQHEAERAEKGLVVASSVANGSEKSVADSSPAAFILAPSRSAVAATDAVDPTILAREKEERARKRRAVLSRIVPCSSSATAPSDDAEGATAEKSTWNADSASTDYPSDSGTGAEEANGAVHDLHQDKFDFMSRRQHVDEAHWSLKPDTADGFILVHASTDDTPQFSHTLASPRAYDSSSRRRMNEFLVRWGQRFDSIAKRETFKGGDGSTWHRTLFPLPVPPRFGQRIAVGEAQSSLEADNVAAMHAELTLDSLGLAMHTDPYQQRRHAHAARTQGRFAPLPREKPFPPSTPAVPPLRKERIDHKGWARAAANTRVSHRGSSTSPAKGSALPSTQLFANADVDDWKTTPYEYIAEGTIDLISKARVQFYQRMKKAVGDAIIVRHVRGEEVIHVARLKLPLPAKYGTRFAMGVASMKKDAENVCFMHAERVIDALGIQLFNLKGMQTRHAERVAKEGRRAPGHGESAERPGETPSPLPLRVGVAPGTPDSSVAFMINARIPAPPSNPAANSDLWGQYVSACERFISDAKNVEEYEAIAAEKAPRTGNVLIDSTLDEVEVLEINPTIKAELYDYCARTSQSYPTHWKTQLVGPPKKRKMLTTVEVPGHEHLLARGLAANKESSHRRAAMHIFALLRRLDPDFASQEESLGERAESVQSVRHASRFKGSYDRSNRSFTQEGKVRLVELFTVCRGIDPPRVVQLQRKEGNFVVQSTAIEIKDADGRTYQGRSRDGVSKANEAAAYDELFNQLWAQAPGFSALGDLVKTHPHLDPEHIVDLSIPAEVQERMEAILQLPLDAADIPEEVQPDDTVDLTTQTLVETTNQSQSQDAIDQQSQILFERLKNKQKDLIYLDKFHQRRSTLTIHDHKEKILATVRDNSITVLCGTTGCGKTTQVPQYLLDEMTERGEGGKCSIIVTQPRRISAVSISQRIADERREQLGDAVGYTIRLDSKPGRHINFCTSGVLLRIFQAKPNLEGITHVIIDEIHERDINSDFLLVLLRDLVQRCPHIRVILMSATLQSQTFSRYFNGAPVINVEGRVYPVKELFLEDLAKVAGDQGVPLSPSMKALDGGSAAHEGSASDPPAPVYEVRDDVDYGAVVFAVEHIRKTVDLDNSSVLVFLPGWDEITKARDHIVQAAPLRYHVITLHSSVSSEEQLQCFKPAPPGKVKLILSTNIAESGVTIDDIAAVVDIGRAKEKSFVMKRGRTAVSRKELGAMSQLVTVYASRANCTQRRGRAGRTREGVVIRLYTRKHLELVADFQTPEMLRQPLDALCLQILALGLGDPAEFLAKALESPSDESIHSAMSRLFELGAISARGKLTPLGLRLSKLPVAPRIGKMIVLGAMFRCLDAALTIASSTDMDVFVTAREHKSAVRLQREEASLKSQSDQLASLNAYNMWVTSNAEKSQNDVLVFLQNYMLNPQTLMVVSQYKKQFYDILVASGFLPGAPMAPRTPIFVDDGEYSRDSSDIGLVKSILCASLFPNVAINRGKRLMRNKFQNVIAPSPASVLHRTSQEDIANPYFVFEEMSKSPEGKMFLRGLTSVSLWSLLLMGASNAHLSFDDDLMLGLIDDWVLFRASPETLRTIHQLKDRMDMLITRKLVDPDDADVSSHLDAVQKIVRDLVSTPIRPNSLVEEPWEEQGVISVPTPLPPEKYGMHFVTSLPPNVYGAGQPGASAPTAAGAATASSGSAAAFDDDDEETGPDTMTTAEEFLKELNTATAEEHLHSLDRDPEE